MPRWTLQMLTHIVTATTLRVITNTSRQDHLFLSWSYTRPATELIYRTVRGKLIRCGYKYIWDTPTTVEQIEDGATWTHTFYLTNLVAGSRLWYYLHAPCPPSEWETQGPLQMIDLLHAGPPGSYLYFASRYLGMFMTTTFSAIGDPQPVWVPDNDGLLSLEISQAVLDPSIPEHYRYVIAGPHLYRMHNPVDFGPATATIILSQPEAIALTGSPDGDILWIEPNRRHPGMLHVLFNSQYASNGFWHLRSLDYGAHWTAHQIDATPFNYIAGNIMAGFNKGTSPHGEGDVLYVPLNVELGGNPHVARSIDQGITWTTLGAPGRATETERPRLHVDPANQAVVYLGNNPRHPELYRSPDHGDTWARVDQGEPITITLHNGAYHAVLRTHEANPDLVRLFTRFWVYTSHDFCASWQGTLNLAEPLRTGRFTTGNPNLLYLAKVVSGTPPPVDHGSSVIFISDDEGLSYYPKAGANPHLADGGGDSIPYSCGGAAHDGILVVQ